VGGNEIVHCPSWAALPGSGVDVTLARRSAVFDKLLDWEYAMCDKGYYGLGDRVVLPLKGNWDSFTLDQQLWNRAINSVRVSQEHLNREIKIFDVLTTPFRHDLMLHPFVFHTAANLANIRMRTAPARHYLSPWLT
jgi:hypothetical protein